MAGHSGPFWNYKAVFNRVKNQPLRSHEQAMSSSTSPSSVGHGRYPQAVTVEDFRRNLVAVQARIDIACRRAGRDPASVRLLPVS